MRIVSLLPSATEFVYALGLQEQLVGVTHECDWPSAARSIRRVSHSAIPVDATSAEIDRLVVESGNGGPTTTVLDEKAIRELAPDVILTQDLCAVCAIASGRVDEALDLLGCSAQVVSLDPSTLDDVIDGIGRIGDVLGRPDEAARFMTGLRDRVEAVSRAVAGQPRPRVFALEWADPPFNAGHWVPEMVELAGGTPVLARRGTPSVRVEWDAIAEARPDAVIFMPCGYPLVRAVQEATDIVLSRPELIEVPTLIAAYGDAFFSRPGPRLVDGVEILAGLLHPNVWAAPSAEAAVVLRPDVRRRSGCC
ncbi:MAG: periplasmic binding protein [Frankiales bacterium]|nr:periplasmic binding protein [Frankiales bacterium]